MYAIAAINEKKGHEFKRNWERLCERDFREEKGGKIL